MLLHAKLIVLHTLFLENKVQIDQSNYGMMLFMSKQVSLWKISSILQKMKIGQKPIYAFLHEDLKILCLMLKKQQTPCNLFLHVHVWIVPAYCKSLCFGKKFFLRYWGHSRYWSILASKILGSDFRFSPLLDSLLAFPDSSKITTSSTLKTARARAICKSNTQRIQILKQDFTCRGMQFLQRTKTFVFVVCLERVF